VYLGRLEKSGKVANISFSGYRAKRIAIFLEQVIQQIDQKLVGRRGLIPFFDGLHDFGKNRQHEDYWTNPHFRGPGLRIRLGYDEEEYKLYVNAPVPFTVREKFPGWSGPTFCFSEQGMKMFADFMRKISHSVVSGC